MIRANIACGTDIRDGWVNVDVVKKWPLARRACDALWDGESGAPLPFADGSVSEVYAGYLFLHLRPRHHDRVIKDISRVLCKAGKLVVGEVDMPLVMLRWMANPSDKYLSGLVWGEMGELPNESADQLALAKYDEHRQGFSEDSLRALMNRGGFRRIRRTAIHGPAVFYELTLETWKD